MTGRKPRVNPKRVVSYFLQVTKSFAIFNGANYRIHTGLNVSCSARPAIVRRAVRRKTRPLCQDPLLISASTPSTMAGRVITFSSNEIVLTSKEGKTSLGGEGVSKSQCEDKCYVLATRQGLCAEFAASVSGRNGAASVSGSCSLTCLNQRALKRHWLTAGVVCPDKCERYIRYCGHCRSR